MPDAMRPTPMLTALLALGTVAASAAVPDDVAPRVDFSRAPAVPCQWLNLLGAPLSTVVCTADD